MRYIRRVSKLKNDDTKGYIINSTNVVDKEKNTYSAEIIDGLVKDVYSTTEQVVGTWIDGKPLYRKVIEGIFNATVNTKGFETSLQSLNIDTMAFIYGTIGYGDAGSGGKHTLGGYLTDGYYSGVQYTGDYRLSVWATKNYNNGAVSIVIYYTKTTD